MIDRTIEFDIRLNKEEAELAKDVNDTLFMGRPIEMVMNILTMFVFTGLVMMSEGDVEKFDRLTHAIGQAFRDKFRDGERPTLQ